VVRDIFVTRNEIPNPNYIHYMSPERVLVDSIVNTIGFPLVGGPAGSMEGGRQIEVSKEILTTKNVPYFVAAPLLIQGKSHDCHNFIHYIIR
jgi:magnesium chelatase subunit H